MTAAQSSHSRQSPSSLPPLTSVQLALGRHAGNSRNEPNGVPVPTSRLTPTTAREHVAALPHVVDTISDFLDVAHPHIWTLPRACEKNLLHLAQRLGARLHVDTLDTLDVVGDGDSIDDAIDDASASTSTSAAATRTSTTEVASLDPHYWAWQCNKALVSAIQHDNLDMVTWLHDYCPRVLPFAAMVEAARRGNVRLLQWLECRHPDAPWVPQMMEDAAASTGELETLKWLHAHPKSVGCSFIGMKLAVENGHLATVKCLHEHRTRALFASIQQACEGVARGHAEVWWFLAEHAKQYGVQATSIIVVAAASGDLARLQSIAATMSDSHVKISASLGVLTAIEIGHLHVVQWFHEHYSDAFSAHTMNCAAKSGNLELVQWLHANRTEGCTTLAMDAAAGCGHLEIVRWLHGHRTKGCTTKAMNDAAANGHLAVVQWLHENRSEGCTAHAMDNAAKNGHIDIVQWLHEHRTEGCTTKAMDNAATNGHLDVVQYLHEHRTEGCTTKAMDSAAKAGHLDVVQWLHENRNEGCTTKAMDNAAMNGHLGIVNWLHEHRHMNYSSDAMHVAAEHGHFDVLLFLHANRSEDIAPGVLAFTYLGIRHLEIVQWLERTHPDVIDLDVMQVRNPEMAAVLAYALGSRA